MSAASDPGDLELRFTEREILTEPPDLAAFHGVDAALLREQAAGHDDHSPLGDLADAGRLASRAVILAPVRDPSLSPTPVFLTARTTPIPAIDLAPGPGPDPHMFATGGPIRGHLAWVPRAGRARPVPAAAAALVLSLSLALPNRAAAAPPPGPVVALPPSLPAEPTAPPELSAPPAPEPPRIPPPNPSAPTEIPPLDRILLMLRGQEAILYYSGRPITGRILSVDGEVVAMVDNDKGGRIVLVPKTMIQDVRGQSPPRPLAELPDGRAPITGGAVLIGIGAPLMISGLVFLGITSGFSSSSTSVWLPQVLPALGFLGAGIPLLVRGLRQRKAYRAARAERMAGVRLSPSFAPTRQGWTGGLTLRF